MSRSRLALLGLVSVAISGPVFAQWSKVEEAKLVAGTAAQNDHFGASVAVDGDTLVVGAPGTNAGVLGAGAAYVFTRSGSVWSQVQQLLAPSPTTGEAFGTAVAIDAGRILVGAPFRTAAGAPNSGAADVFEWNGSSWVHTQQLTAPTPKKDRFFGRAVAVAGDRVLCGAPTKGSVFAFVGGPGVLTFHSKLPFTSASASGDGFGTAVAMDGNRAVAGAPTGWGGLGNSYGGSGTVYSWTGSSWKYEDTIGPRSAGPTGYNSERYGISVAVFGDTVLGGSPGLLVPTATYPTPGGAAHVHVRNGTNWLWRAGLTRGTPLFDEEYGDAVAVSGNLAAAGAPGGSKGLVYVHNRSGGTWAQITKLKASDGAAKDRFGDALALEDRRVIVGTPLHNPGGLTDAGAVYVYLLSPPGPKTYCTSGTSASGCVATLATAGQASASAPSGFVISAASVEGGRPGMLLYGTGSKQALPWGPGGGQGGGQGTSFLCFAAPLTHGGVQPGTGTAGACDGSFAADLNALWCSTCPFASSNPGELATVRAQFWYRDPLSTSNRTTSLSDAVEFVVGP